jgi:hypothetical protein
LLFVLVVAAGAYLAIKFIVPYWNYLSMQDPVKEAAMAAVTQAGEASARAELLRRARDRGLTLDDDDVEFIREGSMLVVRVAWVTPVELPRFRYDLHFRIEQRVPVR